MNFLRLHWFKMGTLHYRGYMGSVEYSESDHCLYGKVQGLHKAAITYEGNTLADLEDDFKAGEDSYLDGSKDNENRFETVQLGAL